jgi:hypothetical protein
MKKFDYSKFKSQKSQSAMEYLMTYGWAILIIAIVLVALFSLGIFNSANFSPRAQPGSCEVLRNSVQTSLVGQCNGELPEYVAEFETSPAYISITNDQYIPYSATASRTMTFWFSGTITSSFTTLFTQTNALGVCGPFNLAIRAYAGYFLHTCLESGDTYSPGFNPSSGWGFAAVVYNSTTGTVTFYYNNKKMLVSTSGYDVSPIVVNTAPEGQFNIGGSDNTGYGENTINGYESNFQIYNTSLSPSEITALYQEGIGGAPINVDNLVGWWPLNGNANDYSGNGNDGTATNVIYTSAWTSGYSAP